MKYAYVVFACLLVGCGGAPNEGTDQASEAFVGPTPNRTLYRGWASGDHFLTTDVAEFNNPALHEDGIIGQCWSGTDGARLPFYRLYAASAGDHLYTVDAAERSAALSHGFVQETTPCYIYPTKAFSDLQPLYRLYNGRSLEHLYTPSATEVNTLTTNLSGWQYEKIAGYYYANQGF